MYLGPGDALGPKENPGRRAHVCTTRTLSSRGRLGFASALARALLDDPWKETATRGDPKKRLLKTAAHGNAETRANPREVTRARAKFYLA